VRGKGKGLKDMEGRGRRLDGRWTVRTMLKAVLSTSFVSGGRMLVISETVAPSRAAFWVVQ
jgi:hypothetical protein